MAAAAERMGLGVMAGCMVATSLAMAPAVLLAQTARFVDLDGPLLLAKDRDDGLRYEDSLVYPAITGSMGLTVRIVVGMTVPNGSAQRQPVLIHELRPFLVNQTFPQRLGLA